MVCCNNASEGKTEVVLIFKREEILYDVRNAAYIEGHIMCGDTPSHVQHTVQDVGEEGNVDRATRIMSLAVSHCRELLYPYTKEKVCFTGIDDTLHEQEEYGIVMQVPPDFSQTTLFLIKRLIHEYIVDKVMADWLSITNPGKSEIWGAKASEAESELRVSLHSRSRRVRRRMHPF